MEIIHGKDINSLDRRATKFILNYNESDYMLIIKFNVLPYMFWYELQDIVYIVKCFQEPPGNFDI